MQSIDNKLLIRGGSGLIQFLVRPTTTLLSFIFCFFLFTTSLLNAETVVGKCVGVSDGDTATILLPDNNQKKIRFWGIDAPESKQDFGQAAKKKLSDLIFQKEVKVEISENDRYGRAIGKVYVDSSYVNLEMVIAGLAWHYVQYAPNDTDLAEAEKFARTLKRGLWGGNSPTPPWEFRKNKPKKEESPAPKQSSTLPVVDNNTEEVTIISVNGADSILVQTPSGKVTTIFLYGCDAPENGQPYYSEAKAHLEEIVGDKKARISYKGDGSRRGKPTAKLYVENVYVNERMVSGGYAHVPPSCGDGLLKSSQEKAKASNYGMWIAGAAVAVPWAYRQVAEARRANAERELRKQQLRERELASDDDDDDYYRPRKRSSRSSSSSSSSSGEIHVKGYRRKDGTWVRPHTRKRK